MLHIGESSFIICIIFYLAVKTLQRELGISQGEDTESNEWPQMKWDSILKDPNSIGKSNELSKDDSGNLDSLLSFENDPNNLRSKVKLSSNELEKFSEDEVFMADSEDIQRKSPKKSIKDIPDKDTNLEIVIENKLSPENQQFSAEELNSDISNKNVESEIIAEFTETSLEVDDSQLLTPNIEGPNHIGQKTEDIFNPRSFIFNPIARPQEQFQNCTTPLNESGSCRYLQHCLIPTIVSSLGQFMEYVCIIEGRYIGVCCPTLPVSVVVIQDQPGNSSMESNPNEECGIATNTRIVGGSNADPKAWPWMVALSSKFRRRFFCGGVLINDLYVLTAAHCTFGVFNNEIIARVGEYDFKDDGGTHDDFAVVEIKRHGHYNRRSLRNDIALLKLEKPVVFNEFVKAICFPEEEQNYVGEKATLAGWGNIAGGGRTSDVLQEASFPVISNEECSEGHGLPIPNSLICTGAESGDKGACNGDSGGPLMLLDKNDRWKAIGLVSWGRRGCNPEFPTVYTRVSHFLEWIKKHSR